MTGAAQSSPAIVAEGLSRRFGDTPAVTDLDLVVPPGETFGLVGPDGAGKTTVIRMLAGIMRPTSGRATVLGHDTVRAAEAIHPRVGYMAQRFSLYRDLTVWENLRFFADAYQVGTADQATRVARALDFARLGSFRDRRAAHLSGGMQKKLALACTLVHQPEVLFLDEPTTGVDPVSRREFWELLTDLHLAGITIFASTPYMDEAERCSRVGLMYRGRLIRCDTPSQIRLAAGDAMIEVRTNEVRAARQVAMGLAGVRDVQTYGDRLHLFADDPAGRTDEVANALAAAGIKVQGVRTTRPRMEEAFIDLIQREEASQ